MVHTRFGIQILPFKSHLGDSFWRQSVAPSQAAVATATAWEVGDSDSAAHGDLLVETQLQATREGSTVGCCCGMPWVSGSQ